MNQILTALWPVFALLCIGYGLRRLDFPDNSFWEPAERLIYFLLFPVLLVYKLSLADVGVIPLAEVALVIALLLVSASLLLMLVQRFRPVSGRVFTSIYQGSMRFNTYVGLAASAALFGDGGVAIAAVIIAVMVPTLNLFCVLIFSVYVRRDAGLLNALLAVIKNPLILACVLGISLNLTGLGLPVMLRSVAGLLSDMALPLGLLAVGASLNLAALRRAGGAVIYSSLIKLLLFPVMMLAISSVIIRSPEIIRVLVMFSALPTAPTAYVLARNLGGDAPMMAAIITAQTLLSMLTMPLILSFL